MAHQASIKVAITLDDGHLVVLTFLTLGRGDMLPFGAEWADREEGYWLREPSEANIAHEIAGYYWGARAVSHRIIREEELPAEVTADRYFREAVRDLGDRFEVDMPAAREIHRSRMRIARAAKLQQLDGEWMRATGQAKKADAEAIEAKRQALRDAPADPAIDAAETPEALRAIWPQELQEG